MRTEIATSLEKSVVAQMNEERAAAGLPELKIEAHLNAAAQEHSDWMAQTGTLAHTGEGGSTPTERIEDTGFPLEGSWGTAENVAYTSISGALDRGEINLMHDGLMDSAGHRANIMNPDMSYVGVGLSVGRLTFGGDQFDVVFLTQNFADTDGEVLVQEEVDGETVLQPYLDGEPVGDPEEAPPPAETDGRDRDDERDGSGGDCFVATAAHGGRAHPDVTALRRFRDEVLVRHAAGRAFVRCYWLVGPRLARLVRHDGPSGGLARGLIRPVARLAGRWTDRRRRSCLLEIATPAATARRRRE